MESSGNIEKETTEIPVAEEISVAEKETSETAVKEELSACENSSCHSKIVKQLEFYFSDINLTYDKFLQKEIKSNDDGWVKISVLLSFKRLASISTNPLVIASAVRNATSSILEVDNLNENIRRKPDIVIPVADQEYLNEVIERSIYCKGFPRTATMDELLDFAATFGDKMITKVTPRRLKNKNFRGSVYFTFNSKEEAEKFLNLEFVKYKDIDLKREWEKDYLERKKSEYESIKTNKIQKIQDETEKYFKKGYLLKADNVDNSVTVDNIKLICSEFKWEVSFVKLVEDQKIAWIRLKPVKAAKELLDEAVDTKNDLNITFSIPEEEIEQSVLNEMTKEVKNFMSMKDKLKREKHKNKASFRYNKRKNGDNKDGQERQKKLKTSN